VNYAEIKKHMGEVREHLKAERLAAAHDLVSTCVRGGLTQNDLQVLLTREEIAKLRSYARSLQR
jgi:hypothetical protein